MAEHLKWPSELESIVEKLEPYQFQRFQETVMSAGNIRRRPLHSPLAHIGCEQALDGEEWALLKRFAQSARNALIEIPSRDGGKFWLVKFGVSKDGQPTPFVKQTTISIQNDTSEIIYFVEIGLLVVREPIALNS